MSETTTYPSLDLPRHRATSVAISAAFEWDDLAVEQIGELLDEDGKFVAARKYKRAGNEISLVEFAEESRLESPSNPRSIIVVSVNYSLPSSLPEEPVPKELRGVGRILQRLPGLGQLPGIPCSVAFEIPMVEGDQDAQGMWFPLPTRLSSSRGQEVPVDEIRGVRGVKLRTDREGRQIEYSFTLDRPGNGPLFLSVDFSIFDALQPSTPLRAIRQAKRFGASLGAF